MARACGHKLADGTKCQIETEASHCELHLLKVHRREVSHPKLIRDFVLSVSGDTVDLTGFHFKTTFDSTMFPANKTVVFDSSEFSDCQFWNMELQSSLSFVGCVFEDTVFTNLSTDTIGGRCDKLDFSSARFRGDKVPFVFCGLRAREKVSFESATFESKDPPFLECYVQSDLIAFADAQIESDRFYCKVTRPNEEVRDHRCLCLDAPKISFARLKANGHFEYGNFEDAVNTAPLVSFRGTDFRQMRTATLRDANLTNALFIESVIEDVTFINPVWQPGDRRTSELYDKVTLDTDERATDDQLLRLYVQLKRNYEEQRDYSMAGKWFFREMECRRRLVGKKAPERRFRAFVDKALFASYSWISGYGESYKRPLMYIFILLVGFATVYFYWIGYPTDAGPVSYEFAFESDGDAVRDFLSALAFSGGIMLFQSIKLALEQPFPTPQLAIVQILLTLILVPLFLLALRRKFRR